MRQENTTPDDDLVYNDEQEENASGEKKPHGPSAWSCWLRMWATPLNGFKRMKYGRLKAVDMESAIFYPMIALCSLGAFADKFYFGATVSHCLIDGTCKFVVFFVAYFLTFPLSRLLMRRDCAEKMDTPFGHCYVAALLSTLCLFLFLYECLPFLEVLLSFTPAYTIYLSYKGMSLFNFPEQRRISTWVALVLLIVALPFLVFQLMGILLPDNIVSKS